MRTVIGLFGNAGEARRAIDELQGLGYEADKISVVTNVATQQAIEARKSMGLESLSLVDVGQVATAGPLREVLSRQAGATGALGSALQIFGLTPELADHYVSGVRHGETLESLTVDDRDSDRVLSVMRRRTAAPAPAAAPAPPAPAAAAEPPSTPAQAVAPDAAPAAKEEIASAPPSAPAVKSTNGQRLEIEARDEERIIPVLREEMRVGRRTVERGGVRVSSHVVERPVSEQVKLRETHVDIERRAVDRPVRADEKGFTDDNVEMIEMADEAVVSKQARVVEEVVVRKHIEDRTATISDKVRSTEIEFGKLRAFDADDSRRHFEGSKIGGSFEPYLPAYQFGHEFHHQKNAVSLWNDVEISARDRWEQDHPGTWERFKDAIRHAWSHARGD
jgi:stress response protein YsnF